jgi:hypothetical protein
MESSGQIKMLCFSKCQSIIWPDEIIRSDKDALLFKMPEHHPVR